MATPKAGPKRPEYEPNSPEQAIGYLIEECGEVLAAAGKSVRWGLDSWNPELPEVERETNAEWLLRELGDLEAAITRVRAWCQLDGTPPEAANPPAREPTALQRCKYCHRVMGCSAKSYEENPYCRECLPARLALASESLGPGEWIDHADGYMRWVGQVPREPTARLDYGRFQQAVEREPTADPGAWSGKDWEKERAISQQRSDDRYGYVLPAADPGEDGVAKERVLLDRMTAIVCVAYEAGFAACDLGMTEADVAQGEPHEPEWLDAYAAEHRGLEESGQGEREWALWAHRVEPVVRALLDLARDHDAITAPLRAELATARDRIEELEGLHRNTETVLAATRRTLAETEASARLVIAELKEVMAERDAALKRAEAAEALLTAQRKATDYACADNVKLRALLARCDRIIRGSMAVHRLDTFADDSIIADLNEHRALTTPGDETR